MFGYSTRHYILIHIHDKTLLLLEKKGGRLIINAKYLLKVNELEKELFQAAKDLTEREDVQENSDEFEEAIETMRIINDYSVLMHVEMVKRYGYDYFKKFK